MSDNQAKGSLSVREVGHFESGGRSRERAGELVDRYRTVVERLRACPDRVADLRLHLYLGDVAP